MHSVAVIYTLHLAAGFTKSNIFPARALSLHECRTGSDDDGRIL